MRTYKWISLVLIFVVIFLHANVQAQVRVQIFSADKSSLVTEGATIIQKTFVDSVNSQALTEGARKGLLKAVQEDSILRTKIFLIHNLSRVGSDIFALRGSYRECVRILGGDTESHLLYAMMRGMAESLGDRHSRFFSPFEAREFFAQLREHVISGGIGIFMSEHASKFIVVDEVVEDTPASRGGLLAKDLIIAVDGVSTEGIGVEKVSERIRGVADTSVRLTVVRKGAVPFDLTFVRKPIRVGSVASSVRNNVGYIKLRFFGEDTSEKIDACFVKFDAAQVKGYVLDMRNNGGGYVNVAVHTVSKFIPGGRIVSSFSGRTYPTEVMLTDGSQARELPVVVLVNKNSASASEIVAGALQDNGYKVVGVKSYGKGSMQQMYPLSDGSMLKVTRAHWFTSNRHPVDGVGITPNIVVEQDENSDEDIQLQRALQEAGQ
ncbi:MAG: S41 family peptidase [Parcubacteria group bacterium]|nr:S41 family peptidase [Parcubacteria group bacterium]